jgi:hypothetical protein
MLKRLQTAVWVAAFACIAFGFGYGFEVWRASQQTPEANQKPAATSQEQPKTQDSKTYLRQTGTAPTQTVGEKGNGTVGEKDDGIHQGLYWIGSRLVAIIEFVDGHEGFFVTLFTAALAVFTWLLAKRTRDLWEAGESGVLLNARVTAFLQGWFAKPRDFCVAAGCRSRATI